MHYFFMSLYHWIFDFVILCNIQSDNFVWKWLLELIFKLIFTYFFFHQSSPFSSLWFHKNFLGFHLLSFFLASFLSVGKHGRMTSLQAVQKNLDMFFRGEERRRFYKKVFLYPYDFLETKFCILYKNPNIILILHPTLNLQPFSTVHIWFLVSFGSV